jgi:CelD/BcsL family acetyltransferase involved in cellulose biosynthesis
LLRTNTIDALDAEIRIDPSFDFLSTEYRELFVGSTGTAFQAPLWQSMLHKVLVPALNVRQHTLTIRERASGRLLVVIPFVLAKARGVTLLMPADFGLCDYNAPIGAVETLNAVAKDADILAEIGTALGRHDLLLFRKVRRDGFDIHRLFPRAVVSACENSAYDISIPEDFDEWRLRVLRRKMTTELGRLGRQLERENGAYETRAATTETEITAAFDFLLRVRRGQFKGDLLTHPLYFEFYRSYAIAAASIGEAVTYVSTVAGKPVAVVFGLQGDGLFHAVQLGHDSNTLGKYSLGIQIFYRVIKLRHGQGHRYFDMGLGNTGYKTHLRVEQHDLDNVVQSATLVGAAASLVYRRAKSLKNALKHLTPIR